MRICFPGREPAVFFSDEEQETAYQVKCPLHGDRSQKHYHLFRPPWLRERQAMAWKNRDAQYKKAWLASGLPAPRTPLDLTVVSAASINEIGVGIVIARDPLPRPGRALVSALVHELMMAQLKNVVNDFNG